MKHTQYIAISNELDKYHPGSTALFQSLSGQL